MGKKYIKILIAAAGVFLAVNTIFIGVFVFGIKAKFNAGYDANRPVNLNAVVIKDKSCGSDCFDIDKALSVIRHANVKLVKEETLDSAQAKDLIAKYNIQKLPTIVFTGEIKQNDDLIKAWEKVGEIKGNAVIFTKLNPPYFDVKEGRVLGKADVVYINDKSCGKCVSFDAYIAKLKAAGVKIANEKFVDYLSDEGKVLVSKYNITKLPAYIMSPDIKYYESALKNWDKVGTVEKDGNYIFRNVDLFSGVSYRDLAKDAVITNK